MGDRLTFELRKPRQRNLRARYDSESDLVFAEDHDLEFDPVGWDHFSIDLHIVFDVDRDLYVADIEFIFPRRSWQLKDGLSFPRADTKADLHASQVDIDRRTSASDVLEVYTNRERNLVSIELCDEVEQPRNVALGDNIIAILDSNLLSGFVMKLES